LRVVGALFDRQHHEGDVQLAALDETQELCVVGRLRELDGDQRPRVAELEHHAWEDTGPDALVRADAERSGGSFRVRCEVGLSRIEAGDDPLRMAEEELPCVRQGDGARATRTFDEPLADDALERGDLLADG
jgi:hypothetical protein